MHDFADSDESLVQATGQGDLAAFNRLVERHQAWAWRVAHRFTGDKDEAADIVQEAFLRLLDASARYRPTAKFRTFFYRIISRLCLDRAKKKKRYSPPSRPRNSCNRSATNADPKTVYPRAKLLEEY